LKKRYIILLTALMLAGCGSGGLVTVDCSQEIEDLEDELGAPDEIQTFQVGRYYRYTWWYYRLGFARTFTWDGGYNSCETTDQNFPPNEGRPGTAPPPGA
jgi:hypothetical protein